MTRGIAVVGMSQSRTALMAGLVSGVESGLLREQVCRSIFSRLLRIVGLVALVLLGIGNVFFIDPILYLRTAVLFDLFKLLPGLSPFGTGVPGITQNFHAHSVLLYGSVFYGLVMQVLSISTITISPVTTCHSSPRTVAYSFLLVVYVIVAGLTESIHSWNYWSVCVVAVTAAILMAGSIQRKAE